MYQMIHPFPTHKSLALKRRNISCPYTNIIVFMLFKLINNILNLTTVRNLSVKELVHKKTSTLMISTPPYTTNLTLLRCTVQYNRFVLFLHGVHTQHTFTNTTNNPRHSTFNLVALQNTHFNFYTPFTLVHTLLFTHTHIFLSYVILLWSSSKIHNG